MNSQKIRKNKGLTQKQLADLTGIPYRTIQRIEANDDCKVSTAIKLAKALETTLDELCLPDE